MTGTISSDNAETSKEDWTIRKPTKSNKNPFSNGKLNIYYLILTPGALIWFALGVPHAYDKREENLKDWPDSANEMVLDEAINGTVSKPNYITPFMLGHFLGSGPLLLACLWNLYFTPYTLEVLHNLSKKIHIYVGRVGLFLGTFLGCIGGFVHVWTDPLMSQGIAIGLSVVGALQLTYTILMFLPIKQAQKLGNEIEEIEKTQFKLKPLNNGLGSRKNSWIVETAPPVCSQEVESRLASLRAQREKLVQKHKFNAKGLFYGSCLGPFWFRIIPLMIALFQGINYKDVNKNYMFIGLIPNILIAIRAAAMKPGQWL